MWDGWHQEAQGGFLSLVTVGTGYLLQPHSDRGVQGDGGGGQALLKQHQKNFGAAGVCVPDLWLSSPGETGHQAPRRVPRAFQGGSKAFIALSESCL